MMIIEQEHGQGPIDIRRHSEFGASEWEAICPSAGSFDLSRTMIQIEENMVVWRRPGYREHSSEARTR